MFLQEWQADATQITVTSAAKSIKELVEEAVAAASGDTISDEKWDGSLAPDIISINPENGDIRYMNGGTPTEGVSGLGMYVFTNSFATVKGTSPRSLMLVRAGSSDVKVNLQFGRQDSKS